MGQNLALSKCLVEHKSVVAIHSGISSSHRLGFLLKSCSTTHKLTGEVSSNLPYTSFYLNTIFPTADAILSFIPHSPVLSFRFNGRNRNILEVLHLYNEFAISWLNGQRGRNSPAGRRFSINGLCAKTIHIEHIGS